MINRINNTPSFGRFKIKAQGCNPLQKEFLAALKNSFGEKEGISITQKDQSSDMFIKFKPLSNSIEDRTDALMAEADAANDIHEQTRIPVEFDVDNELNKLFATEIPLQNNGVNKVIEEISLHFIGHGEDYAEKIEEQASSQKAGKLLNFSDFKNKKA